MFVRRKKVNQLQEQLNKAKAKTRIMENALTQIANQETEGANATVRRMARIAKETLGYTV